MESGNTRSHCTRTVLGKAMDLSLKIHSVFSL